MATDTPPPPGQTESDATRCANCGIPVDGEPVSREERSYCCDGCSGGGPCVC